MIVDSNGEEEKANDKEELAPTMDKDMDESSDDEKPAFSLSCKVASKTPETAASNKHRHGIQDSPEPIVSKMNLLIGGDTKIRYKCTDFEIISTW